MRWVGEHRPPVPCDWTHYSRHILRVDRSPIILFHIPVEVFTIHAKQAEHPIRPGNLLRLQIPFPAAHICHLLGVVKHGLVFLRGLLDWLRPWIPNREMR